MRNPTIVVSLSRCGSSMVCGVLAACGARFGSPLKEADEFNPTGYWENLAARKTFKRTLKRWRRKPDPLARAAADMRSRMAGHWLDADTMKIPITWAHWPLIHAAYPRARWILVRREVPDIVASCIRAPFMRGHDTPEAWTAWVEANVATLVALKETPINWVEIWPNPKDPDVFRPMVEHAGLTWDREAVEAFLQPDLWRGRSREVAA